MPKSQKNYGSSPASKNKKDDLYDMNADMEDFVQKPKRKLSASQKTGSKMNTIERKESLLDLSLSEDSFDSDDNMSDFDSSMDGDDQSQDGEMEDNSASENSESSSDFDDRQWGRKKSVYHKKHDLSDDEHSGSEEEELAEEREVVRLQKRKAAERQEDDFDDSLHSLSLKNQSKDKSSSRTTMTSTDEGLLETMYKEMSFGKSALNKNKSDLSGPHSSDLADIDLMTSDGRDLSALSKQEKLELITKDSPELLLLLDSFSSKMVEIRERLAPLIQRARDQQIPTSKGLSYLETKYHLLLNYCTNVCFYLLLKAEGKSVKNHPVIEHLARTRTVIDRLKPLDQKLKYQIDKLLKMAAVGEANVQSDPKLRRRANVKGFVPLEQDLDNQEFDSENEEDSQMEDEQNKPQKYVAPKIAPVGADEKDKEEKRRQRAEAKARSSSMAQFLLEEFGDRPVERSTSIGGASADRDLTEAQEERRRYEEDNFVRLGSTKMEKKALLKARNKISTGLEDLADFGDLSALDRAGALQKADELESRAFAAKRKKNNNNDESTDKINSILDSIDQRAKSSTSKMPKYGVDEDIDYEAIKDAKKAKRKKLQEEREAAELQHLIDADKRKQDKEAQEAMKKSKNTSLIAAHDDDDEFYKEALEAHQLAKSEKKAMEREARRERKAQREADEAEASERMDESEVTGKRKATTQITDNVGLRKQKQKDLKNSRIKFKNKHKDAMKRLKGSGPREVDTSKVYAGTSGTGINKRAVKSTLLS